VGTGSLNPPSASIQQTELLMKVEPRPLTHAERRILEAVLGPEFDGVRELRDQAAAAQVVG